MPQPSSDLDSDLARDLAQCAAMLRQGSRTFYAASLVLPRSVREPASALYAFCRLADDAVDLEADPQRALAALRYRLERVYAGAALPLAADRAFADVVRRFAVPRTLPEALLEGFAWDAQGREYDTLSDLTAYAVRVAGTVGAMMALLMGARAPDVLARACDLGVAMQLTNIARDVGEDARAGRLYLPREWLREVGIDPHAWRAQPAFSDALGAIVQRLLHVADVLYLRAAAGIGELPLACRPGMHAARLIYAEIGREVERIGLDSVSRRAVVSGARKARLLAGALVPNNVAEQHLVAAPLPEARFVIDAAAAAPARTPAPDVFVLDARLRWSVEQRVGWLVDLFDRLERRDQLVCHGACERSARASARAASRA
jgi:phytoene synthase